MELKKENIKLLKKFWNDRNPQHYVNLDSGEDMFWATVLCIFNDMNNALQSLPKEVEKEQRKNGVCGDIADDVCMKYAYCKGCPYLEHKECRECGEIYHISKLWRDICENCRGIIK